MKIDEIIELEGDLGGIGLDEQQTYCLIEPENWDKGKGRFTDVLSKEETNPLREMGFKVRSCIFLIKDQEAELSRSAQSYEITGPRFKGLKEAERIAEKFGVEKIYLMG